MNKKRLGIFFIYIIVFLLCFGILRLFDLKPGHDNGETEESVQLTTEYQPESEGTPSDAEESSSQAASEHTGEDFWETGRGSTKNAYDRNTEESIRETESIPETEEETRPTVIIASDLHYLSPQMTDYGIAYDKFVKKDDGKVLDYSSELIDAFLDEVIAQSPTALVLSGDLTLNGEEMNHRELADKLKRVRNAGIQVLAIPGNHDINNPNASSFVGEERLPAKSVNAEEFYEIYRDLGYDDAVSRDENSLSYIYRLDEKNWLMMLDSCQYEPVNLVGGRIREETYPWMDGVMEAAGKAGAFVLPIAHHNLLGESRLYTVDCTLEENNAFVDLLQRWNLPLYMSGHLHLQRIKKYKAEPGVPDEEYSVTEIVSNALSIAPCQYGVITWTEDGKLEYRTNQVDVSSWAAANGIKDENLLDFKAYGDSHLVQRIADQVADGMSSLPDYQIEDMSRLYGMVNGAYCAGLPIDVKALESSPAYRLWERNLPDSEMFAQIQLILKDTRKDNNTYDGDVTSSFSSCN